MFNKKSNSNTKLIKGFLPLVVASTAVLSNSGVAQAVSFNFTYAPGVTTQQMVNMETAGMIWSDYLADDITVNVHIESTNQLSNNVIGGSLPGIMNGVSYGDFRNGLNANRSSSYDDLAYNNLSFIDQNGVANFDVKIDAGFKKPTQTSSTLNMTRANAKALGILDAHNTQLDGYILMSDLSGTSVDWSYNPNSTSSNTLDYLSVAVHELGHTLGFISGVDRLDIDNYTDLNDVLADYADEQDLDNQIATAASRATTMDMYRYSNKSVAEGAAKGNNVLDFTTSNQSYFSTDGGQSELFEFAKGQSNGSWGDGYQASHWKQRNSDVIGIMDPLLNLGQVREISDRDLRMFDAIGYTGTANGTALMTAGESQVSAVSGFGTDASVLQSLAQVDVAASIGLDGVSSLTQDRTTEVQTMIEASMIYEWGGGWNQTTSFWQTAGINNFSWQTANLDSEPAPEEATSVPEPGTNAGFLALALMGMTALLKRKK